MREHFVFIRPAGQGPAQRVAVWAFGENDAVQKVARRGFAGTIFAVKAA